jgi:predicted dehydrogenase
MKRSVVIIGCGNRGLDAYGAWLARYGGPVQVVGLVDPKPERIALGRRLFPRVPEGAIHRDWRQFVRLPRQADAVIIATQDREHRGPALACARRGYQILLEKPMAPTEKECREIVRASGRAGVTLAVAHVLRYAPHFLCIRRLIDEGAVGEVVTVQHAEDVAYWHQAHSFVRGNWRNEGLSSFMLLAKSCHDLDLLRYYAGRRCLRVHSFGGLLHFRKERKPPEAGRSKLCLECAHEPRCPYSALKIYLRDRLRKGERGWPMSVLAADPQEESLLQALREGPYGRCVYECDNDVVDHQVVNLEYEGGVTATFTMSAFNEGGRKTVVQGSHGLIRAEQGRPIRVLDFLSDRWREVSPEPPGPTAGRSEGHGGGDEGLMAAWTAALQTGDRRTIVSGPEESLETHLTVFAAERSRRLGRVQPVTC